MVPSLIRFWIRGPYKGCFYLGFIGMSGAQECIHNLVKLQIF